MKIRSIVGLLPLAGCFILAGCAIVTVPYGVGKMTVEGAYNLTVGATTTIYNVVMAPLEWPLLHPEIETIDGLPVKEAIRLGRVKCSPYTVNGITYYPMTVEQAQGYSEVGLASWYGYETVRKNHGCMTANGEAFDPNGLSAAHKYLPLPTDVRVTNLENNRSAILRVNDRGPFPCEQNPRSGERIIDVSMGAAKMLGFHGRGTAWVKVEVVQL